MPYYDKQKDRWVGQIKRNNRIEKRKMFRTQKEALKWEIEQVAEPEAQRTNSISLLEFLTKYLEFSEQKHVKDTFEEKRLAFKLFLHSINPEMPVKDVNKMHILEHLQDQARERSGNAANKDRKNLVAAWNWGKRYISGFPSENPCLIDRFPEVRKRRYVPPEQDFWKALEQVGSEQDKCMLITYLHLGARRTEIFTLRWEDVDFAGQQIRLYTRKRRDGSLEYDHLHMTGELFAHLINWKRSATSEWVFPDPKTGEPYKVRRRWLKGLCKRAGVKYFGLHGIRHLTASILVQEDVPLIDIQGVMRHKSISTTERYIHRLKSVRSSLKVFEGRSKTSEPARLTKDQLKVVGG